MKKNTILSAKDISIGYITGRNKIKTVHSNLSFELKEGELISLIGPNGAGKSTLLRTLSTSQALLSGNLTFRGKAISSYSEKEISKNIGIVLTDSTQTGGLSVYELVSLGRQPHTGFFGRLNNRDNEIISEALEAVGINHKSSSYMSELSDGEKQKAMIAKVLVQECPLILLDEPTAFLDVVSRIEIMNLLHKIASTQNKTILLSTHDIEQALILSDKLWLLSKSKGLQCGVTEDIILSGSMDSLFNKKDISFDTNHGVYYPKINWKKKIIVTASNETLLHWCINALNRHNYACMSLEDENTANYAILRISSKDNIEILNPNKISSNIKDSKLEFNNFESLLEIL